MGGRRRRVALALTESATELATVAADSTDRDPTERVAAQVLLHPPGRTHRDAASSTSCSA